MSETAELVAAGARNGTAQLPTVLGGVITWSWWGALTAFFWPGWCDRVLHHITWSINSICDMIGNRLWTRRDCSTNFWPLAIASMGEPWHNLHHADPTCARHGVGRGQIDLSARIWSVSGGPMTCGGPPDACSPGSPPAETPTARHHRPLPSPDGHHPAIYLSRVRRDL